MAPGRSLICLSGKTTRNESINHLRAQSADLVECFFVHQWNIILSVLGYNSSTFGQTASTWSCSCSCPSHQRSPNTCGPKQNKVMHTQASKTVQKQRSRRLNDARDDTSAGKESASSFVTDLLTYLLPVYASSSEIPSAHVCYSQEHFEFHCVLNILRGRAV